MDFEALIVKVAKTLDKLGIPYYITGGYAVSVWGRLRATFDIDVVLQLFDKNINGLVDTLRKLGKQVYVDEDMIRDAVRRHSEFNVVHIDSGIKIDFWVGHPDAHEKMVLARRKVREIKKQRVHFISPEDLILSKLRWVKKGATDYHLDDARSVIKKMGDELDFNYLEKQAEEQSVPELYHSLFERSA